MTGRIESLGYTLLELLVVMSIAAMLAALVRPMYATAVPGARLKTDATNLAASLREARNRAVSSGRRVAVVFEPEAATYTIADGAATELSRGTLLSFTPPGVEAKSTDEPIRLTFYADGSSSGGSVALQSNANAYRIDVDWLTGRVRVTGGIDADT